MHALRQVFSTREHCETTSRDRTQAVPRLVNNLGGNVMRRIVFVVWLGLLATVAAGVGFGCSVKSASRPPISSLRPGDPDPGNPGTTTDAGSSVIEDRPDIYFTFLSTQCLPDDALARLR